MKVSDEELKFLEWALKADLALYRLKAWLDKRGRLLAATDVAEAAEHLDQARELVLRSLRGG